MEDGANSARLAIGQAIALLFELAREVDSDLLDGADSNETYSLVEQLATESNRYTARKERNQIRAHFRDVLQTLNVSHSYSIVILKVGSIEFVMFTLTHTHTHTHTHIHTRRMKVFQSGLLRLVLRASPWTVGHDSFSTTCSESFLALE